MEVELKNLKVKLIVSTLLIPTAKSAISILLVFIPFSQYLMDLPFFSLILGTNSWATLANPSFNLDNLLTFLLYPNRVPFLLIYLHFTVVVGATLCNIYQASQLFESTSNLRADNFLSSLPRILPNLHIHLFMSYLSLTLHMFPLLFTGNLPFLSILASAQIGMEFAIFFHFNLVIKTINQFALPQQPALQTN